MDKKEFVQSYYNTIKNMDLSIVNPYSETQIQPLYNFEWLKETALLYLDLQMIDEIDYKDVFINQSIIRSMMIMDIIDLYYLNASEGEIYYVVSFYDNILDKIYSKDKYSLVSNIPESSKYYKYEDYSFFMKKESNYNLVLGELFAYCYAKWGDMFADNSYEITGPHKIKEYQIINNTFYIEDNKYNVLQYFSKNEKISIDMFGHSIANNCLGKVVLENNKIVENVSALIEIIKQKNREMNIIRNEQENKEWMIDSRIYRYKKIEKLTGNKLVKNNYYRLVKQPIRDKICKAEELKEIVERVLNRGGF